MMYAAWKDQTNECLDTKLSTVMEITKKMIKIAVKKKRTDCT